MPVTIDICEDARYQQGVEEGKEVWKEIGKEEEKEKTAKKMFENGLEFSLVQNITGLDKAKLEEIAKSVSES